MRLLLIVAAFALMATASSAQVEDSGLPVCSTAELAVMSNSIDGIYDLFDRVGEFRVMDDVLAYGHAHLEWRHGMWSRLPLCAPAFDIALLANQLIGDYVPLVLLNSLPDDYGENPYRAGQRSGLARLDALVGELPAPSSPAEAPPAGALPACSAEEIRLLLDTLSTDYRRLTTMANAIEITVDYLEFAAALQSWRATLLTRYPPCAEAIEFAWLASQTIGDVSALFAFHFMGLEIEEMPYDQPERQGTGRLGEIERTLRASLGTADESGESPLTGAAETFSPEMQELIEIMGYQAVTPSGSNWRACTANELLTILDLIPDYDALTTRLTKVETMEALLVYSAAMVAWRERLVFDLPHCGEVLEVAWIMSEHLGDLALIYALFLIDVPVSESPLYQEVMNNRYGVPVWADVLRGQLEQRQDGPVATLGSGDLPNCTRAEIGAINSILADHYALYDAAGTLESLAAYIAFNEAQLVWRERNWARLPLCGDSFEYFLRMNWTNNDTTVAGVLHFHADVAYEDNPFWAQLPLFKERADVLLNRLRDGAAATSD